MTLTDICEICGATEDLQTHHTSYKPKEEKHTVCRTYHKEQHPKHGTGCPKGSGGCKGIRYTPKQKRKYIQMRVVEKKTRKEIITELGINSITLATWDKVWGIKTRRNG